MSQYSNRGMICFRITELVNL